MTVENQLRTGEVVTAPQITVRDVLTWKAADLANRAVKFGKGYWRNVALLMAGVSGIAAQCGLIPETQAAIPTEEKPPATATFTPRPPEPSPTATEALPPPTATATEAPPPEPTVVAEFVRREVGGVQGEPFTVRRGEEEQIGWKYKMPSGETIFQIGYIDMLPDGSFADPDLKNEAVYYVGPDGERTNTVFLTLRGFPKDNADLANHPEALPFVQVRPIGMSYPDGAIVFVDGESPVAFTSPFGKLQEGEEKVVLNGQKGVYEFQDKDGNILREIEIFSTELKSISLENATFVEWTPEEIEKALIESARKVEERILAGEDVATAFPENIKTVIPFDISSGGEIIMFLPDRSVGWGPGDFMGVKNLPRGQEIIFKAPVSGTAFLSSIEGNPIVGVTSPVMGETEYAWYYFTLSLADVVVANGQQIKVGDPLFSLILGPETVRAEEDFHRRQGIPEAEVVLVVEGNTNWTNYTSSPYDVELDSLDQILKDEEGNPVIFAK